VASGIVGARLYHVLTSWNELPDEWWGPFAIWKGGLGVWGGIGLGVIVGAIVAKRSGADLAKLADCVAPALLVAQGIGRFGNWWNQELFGGPTDLPWGLEIAPENRPIENVESDTFHPTFLYEALWCFAAAGILLLIERRFRIRPGGLFALYVLIYSTGRFWIEMLRVDPSHEWGGVRLNVYVSGIAIILSGAFFIWWQKTWPRGAGPPPKPEAMAIPKGQ
jgi:prolipoprotein diacylglyceryl transferase